MWLMRCLCLSIVNDFVGEVGCWLVFLGVYYFCGVIVCVGRWVVGGGLGIQMVMLVVCFCVVGMLIFMLLFMCELQLFVFMDMFIGELLEFMFIRIMLLVLSVVVLCLSCIMVVLVWFCVLKLIVLDDFSWVILIDLVGGVEQICMVVGLIGVCVWFSIILDVLVQLVMDSSRFSSVMDWMFMVLFLMVWVGWFVV